MQLWCFPGETFLRAHFLILSLSFFYLVCFLSRRPDAKDNSFTRSRSSSVTSIDRESREAISSFHFCESFPRKAEGALSPCLLVGTTQGSVLMVALNLPQGGEPRQPVSISSCGKTLVSSQDLKS